MLSPGIFLVLFFSCANVLVAKILMGKIVFNKNSGFINTLKNVCVPLCIRQQVFLSLKKILPLAFHNPFSINHRKQLTSDTAPGNDSIQELREGAERVCLRRLYSVEPAPGSVSILLALFSRPPSRRKLGSSYEIKDFPTDFLEKFWI